MLRRAALKLLSGILVLPFVSLYKKTTWNIKSGSQMRFHTLFDRDDVFYRAMKSRGPMIMSSREMRIPLKLKGE